MLREEYQRRLVDNSYIDLYLSGMDGARIYWPWRMMPVHEASKRYRNACEKFIVDSSFTKENITNEDVLDKAFKLNAEVAVLADVYEDKEATIDAILEGLETYDEHSFDGKIMAPLQAPHDMSFLELEGQGIDMVAIGGFKDKAPSKKLSAARSLRNVAGDSVHIHGLGWGLSKKGGAPNKLVHAINENPDLLDSIDYSTPVAETMSTGHAIDSGEEYTSIQAAKVGAWMIRDLRRVSSYSEDNSAERQTQLSDIGQKH